MRLPDFIVINKRNMIDRIVAQEKNIQEANRVLLTRPGVAIPKKLIAVPRSKTELAMIRNTFVSKSALNSSKKG